jgi:hypothetical protein
MGHIRTENLASNLIGRKDLISSASVRTQSFDCLDGSLQILELTNLQPARRAAFQ